MSAFNRILVINLADIGDLILTTPALDALRKSYPNAQIDMLTTPHAAPILDHTGLVDYVITSDKYSYLSEIVGIAAWRKIWRLGRQLRAEHYDTVLIFRHLTSRFGMFKHALLAYVTGASCRAGLDNGRGWFLTHKADDQGFGAKHEAEYWVEVVQTIHELPKGWRNLLRAGCNDADREWARQHIPDTVEINCIAIHPGSGGYSLARRWEPEKFATVADNLIARGMTVVLVGGPNDNTGEVLKNMKHSPVNLVGQTTLGQLRAVLDKCGAYIGADSGILHLYEASESGGYIKALFGPSNHLAWGLSDKNIINDYGYQVIRSGSLCSPCSYVGHTVGLRNGCEARTCMKMIQPEHVLNRIPFPQSHPRVPPALTVLGIPVNALTFAELLDTIKTWVDDKTGMPRQICTVNPEFIMTAQKDVNFYNILNRCHLCIPDGVGLLWAARRLGHPLPERVTGSDGVPLIAERAAREGWRLFLLGAAPGVAEKAGQVLRERYPGLQIVGTYAGSPAATEEDDIVQMINAANADILFVAYGAPNQDKWIARNLPRLGVRVAMGIGGSLDFVAGVTQRAPVWMRQAGIEWLHRLIKQPWRWRRMLRLPLFMLAVLRRGERGPSAYVGYKKHRG